jgi:geranylgeranyl reductase family protein
LESYFDVIIVGAGPSGAMLAYELSRTGVNVLLIEKQVLPRYKCCAGGVTFKAAELLPINISDIAEDVINGVDIFFKGECRYQGSFDKGIIYTVMRDRFDYALTRKAEEAGSRILQGQPVTHIQENVSGVEVYTPEGTFRSRFLIGADGRRSIVARESGLNDTNGYIAGINAEVSVEKEDLNRWRSRILIDLGCIAGGYGWIFPKASHLSIGIACISLRSKDLKHAYHHFLDSLHINHFNVIRSSGGLLPICKGEPKLYKSRIALIGDAAGLADPFTGEGIYNAIQSALLAAPVIRNCLSNPTASLEEYQQTVYKTILPEIKIGRTMQKIFIRFPELVTRLLNVDPRAWRVCCYMARGELDYRSSLQKAGGFKAVSPLILKTLVSMKKA